jgi:hypothetical protein
MAHPFKRKQSTRRKQSINLQIGVVMDAIAQAEPDLFGMGNAVLMPVTQSSRLTLADDLHPYYDPLTHPYTRK